MANQNETSVMSLKDLFFTAVENNIIPFVEKIIDRMRSQNISINVQNDDKCTALCIAADKGFLELVTLLLNHKDIEPNERALTYAIWYRYEEIVKLLLEHPKIDTYLWVKKAFIKTMEQEYDATPILQYLFKHPSIDIAAYGGEALYNAIGFVRENNIIILFNCSYSNQLDINCIHPKTKATCLFYAFKCAETSKKNVEIERKEKDKEYYKGKYLRLINIIKLLLSHKDIDVNIMYNTMTRHNNNFYDYETEWTALYYTVRKRNIELAQLLLDHPNIDPNIICDTELRETALHAAIRNKNTEMVELLRKHPKIDLFIRDKEGKMAFDLLKAKERKEYIENIFTKITNLLRNKLIFLTLSGICGYFIYKKGISFLL